MSTWWGDCKKMQKNFFAEASLKIHLICGLKIFFGYNINYLSIWPFMRHPCFPTRKASKKHLSVFSSNYSAQCSGWKIGSVFGWFCQCAHTAAALRKSVHSVRPSVEVGQISTAGSGAEVRLKQRYRRRGGGAGVRRYNWMACFAGTPTYAAAAAVRRSGIALYFF